VGGRRTVRRGLVVALVLGFTVGLVVPVGDGVAGAATSPWRPPVAGPVVRGFREPTDAYGAGHRGVDYLAPVGTPVGAAGPGVVAFAGAVGGSLHVVVDHGGGTRTSTSFLAEVLVAEGDNVVVGTTLGRAGGSEPGSGHEAGVVHFGVRVGERYVDPVRLFAPGDLTDRVRLAPSDGPAPDPGPWVAPADEIAGPPAPDGGCGAVVDVPVLGSVVDGVTSAVCEAVDWAARQTWVAVQVGLWVVAGLDVGGRAVVRRLTPVLRRVVRFAATLSAAQRARFLSTPPGRMLRDLYEIGQRAVAAFTRECSDEPVAARPSAPRVAGAEGATVAEPHRVMAVAGIDSHTRADGHTFGLDLDAIGVRERDVTWFSYAADGGAYTAPETERDLRAAARRFAEQLRTLFVADPTRPVDVVAHSQGGIVVDWFLTHQYDRHPERYPPLTTVVTLSSPHQGAPLATTVGALRTAPTTRSALGMVDRLGVGPSTGSRAVRQLAEGSAFMRALWSHPVPSHLAYVSVGGTDDVVVPADRIHVEGAQEIVIAVDGPNDHSAIVDDPRAMEVVRRALAGQSLPCMTFEEGVRSATEPVVLSRIEGDLGPALVAFTTVGT